MSTNQASAVPQRVAIILNGPNDWDEWIEVVKTKTMGSKIWDYVNPAIAKDQLSILERPSIPRPIDVNPQKATISVLDEDEKEELKLLRYNYKHRLATYKQ
jgi:hypothetical protein